MNRLTLISLITLVCACGDDVVFFDGGVRDAGTDAPADATSLEPDVPSATDAGGGMDAGGMDAGGMDSGGIDAGADECLTDNGGCDPLTTCSVEAGAVVCGACPDGYSGSGEAGCVDVNECTMALCAQECVNSPGSFICTCTDGYELNADGLACDNLDECALETDGCAQLCTDTPGSFECACESGYELNADGLACDDIDECALGTDGCDQECTNEMGAFSCSCGDGYELNADGLACDNLDECALETDDCDQECTDTAGSFTCSCSDGFEFADDGVTCEPLRSVYWVRTNTSVNRYRLDGVASEVSPTGTFAVAVDHGRGLLFFGDADGLKRANLDGSGSATIVPAAMAGSVYGLALDRSAQKIYWSDFNGDQVLRSNYDGTNVEPLFAADSPSGLDVDEVGGKVYVIQYNNTRLRRANLDGTDAETIAPSLGGQGVGVAVDPAAGRVYYTTRGTSIFACDLDGSNITTILPGESVVQGLALDRSAGVLYFASGGASEIRSVNVDGSGVATVTAATSPWAVAF